ncbi:Ivy family c-type lysozyme inhibitor [Paenirhodobacter enshiensis]|uniref:Ivy family c-type lysozyme inhibitor n=1 Tax=Paenirhodobacter enshiensis TaxID=1105367 RepID=UPI00068AB7D9|nr:Ivy family c-type lysozyme inhibitor [Paenirhodobacter enshiensis]
MRLILLIALLAVPGTMSAARAEAPPVTLSVEMKDAAFAHRLRTLFGKEARPDWLAEATEAEPVAVTLDGRPYTVLLACKKHDCANHQLAILFDAERMYGLRFETRDNSAEERLTWLNIGGGAESIDGRTILYAAITGSLFNHPDAFSFR